MEKRPSEKIISALKSQIDLVDFIRSSGIELKEQGQSLNYVGPCPFHEDKKTSLLVNRSAHRWSCLEGCGKDRDQVDWVMKKEKVDEKRAVLILKKRLRDWLVVTYLKPLHLEEAWKLICAKRAATKKKEKENETARTERA